MATKLLMVQKWSIMWKSLIASSFEETLFPYCRYIRALDFRDLENLLDDDQFKIKISKQFFTGALARFYKADTLKRANGRKYERLDIKAIIDAIGEVVTEHTPMLEIISGQRKYITVCVLSVVDFPSHFICAGSLGPKTSSASNIRALGRQRPGGRARARMHPPTLSQFQSFDDLYLVNTTEPWQHNAC